MPKGKSPIFIEGVPHRMRRGKLVPIPEKWLGGGNVTHSQTIRKRPSKNLHKLRKMMKTGRSNKEVHEYNAPTLKEFEDDY